MRRRPGADEGGGPPGDALGPLLAMLGHELRAPITVIAGFTHLLLDEQAGPLTPEQRHFLEEVQRSCERVGRFLGELSAAHGRLSAIHPVRPQGASLAEVAEGVAASLKPLLDQKRQSLQLRVAPGAAHGWFDSARIEQVLHNLIGNAIKYGPEGGRIDVAAERVGGPEGEVLAVSVSDEGPGFPAADRERIFEPWLRLKPDAGPTGLGLGLAICRAIVTAHGGRIHAEAAPGRGSRFVFTLPWRAGGPS